MLLRKLARQPSHHGPTTLCSTTPASNTRCPMKIFCEWQSQPTSMEVSKCTEAHAGPKAREKSNNLTQSLQNLEYLVPVPTHRTRQEPSGNKKPGSRAWDRLSMFVSVCLQTASKIYDSILWYIMVYFNCGGTGDGGDGGGRSCGGRGRGGGGCAGDSSSGMKKAKSIPVEV